MIIAEEVILPEYIVTMLDADFPEVVFGGFFGADPDETTELGNPDAMEFSAIVITLEIVFNVSSYCLNAIVFVIF